MDWRRQELNREFDEQALDAFDCPPAKFLDPTDLVAQYGVGRWELLAYRFVRYAIVALLMVPVLLLLRNLL